MKDADARYEIKQLKEEIERLRKEMQESTRILAKRTSFYAINTHYSPIIDVLQMLLRHLGLDIVWLDGQEGRAILTPKDKDEPQC